MDNPLVIVKTFSNRLEAEMAKGALEAAGIGGSIHTDDLGGLRPDLAQRAGVHLVVREEDAAQAADLLAGIAPEPIADDNPEAPE